MANNFKPEEYETDQEAIADAIFEVAKSINILGNGNAATSMGAIEAFGLVVKEGLAQIAEALEKE